MEEEVEEDRGRQLRRGCSVLLTVGPRRGEDWSEDWEEVERQEETELMVWPPPTPARD